MEKRRRHSSTEEPEEDRFFEQIAVALSLSIVILLFPLAIFFCITIVPEYQRAVIFRLGRLRKGGARGPGMVFILPCIDEIEITDLRTATLDVNSQKILTKDSVTIKIKTVIYYRIVDPLSAVIEVEDFRESTMLLGQSTLRHVAGTKELQELLTQREEITHSMKQILDKATDPWGIKVERVEIRDVRLPPEMQKAMACEAEANREARAKIIAAEGEKNASEALKKASETMSSSPSALQLRYLQTVTSISTENNHMVIFLFPVEAVASYLE